MLKLVRQSDKYLPLLHAAGIYYLSNPTPYILCCVARMNCLFYCGMFRDDDVAINHMAGHFPHCSLATLEENQVWETSIFPNGVTVEQPAQLDATLIIPQTATDFQLSVWQQTITINRGQTVSYKELATQIGKPRAYRAVGNAMGKNPFSYLIPCHRVIAHDGSIGGFGWDIAIKHNLLNRETTPI